MFGLGQGSTDVSFGVSATSSTANALN